MSRQDRLMEISCLGQQAWQVARLCGVNHKTAACFFYWLRQMIAIELAAESAVDERCFRGNRKSQQAWGAVEKALVFGLLRRADKGHMKGLYKKSTQKVYTKGLYEKYPGCLITIMTLDAPTECKVVPDSMVVCSDGWKRHKSLGVAGFFHACIHHSKHFVNGRHHVNGIENVWNQAKRPMRRFNGVPGTQFELYFEGM